MTATEFWMILGMFAVTFGVRYPVLAFVSRVTLPPMVERALRYVPAAVLSAIVAPSVIIGRDGAPDFSLSNAALIASLAAVLVSWRTKNLLLTIIAGMGVFLAWRAVF
jgi:branched-subunit amino acid transport protein